ncbi:MAG: hypothetical protein ACRCVU_04930 [Flavobacterium sp.]
MKKIFVVTLISLIFAACCKVDKEAQRKLYHHKGEPYYSYALKDTVR